MNIAEFATNLAKILREDNDGEEVVVRVEAKTITEARIDYNSFAANNVKAHTFGTQHDVLVSYVGAGNFQSIGRLNVDPDGSVAAVFPSPRTEYLKGAAMVAAHRPREGAIPA